jgi:hypothetical protein
MIMPMVQVEPQHLAERDQRAERDRDPRILQAFGRGLRHRGHQPHPGRRDQQQLAGIPHLPGISSQFVSSGGHQVYRLSITRRGAPGSS